MSDTLDSTFQRLTTALSPGSFTLSAHQAAVAEGLLSGRRTVLRAPAGSGKSLAGWLPWLAGRMLTYDFPAQLLHILPGGIFFVDQQRKLEALTRDLGVGRISVQNEGDAFDPFLLADAAFTTVDELLSMALHHPLGLYPGLSNIIAGALLGAYLYFDEFPAFASREALGLWLRLLHRYYPFTPCLFSSAFLPRPLMARIAEELQAEFIDASAAESGGRRIWIRQSSLGVEGILRQHRSRTIVVCNTVRGAQALYRALTHALRNQQVAGEIILLHQHQFYRHRRPVMERAAEMFRPDGDGKGLLITTSGIEVGADFSAETLISDPVSPDHLLLRAARCGRFGGETGRMVVARVSDYVPAEQYPAPSWERFVEQLADETPHSAAEELAVFDALWETDLSAEQREAACALPPSEERDAELERILAGDAVPERIFSRVGVALHMVPETVQDPFELERLSLAVSSLERGWRQWQTGGSSGEWFALIPQWPAGEQQSPSWSPVSDARQFCAAARLIVLNADAVSYDPIIGLELQPGSPFQSDRLETQHTSWSPFDQHVQPYEEHATRTLEAYESMQSWYRYALRHLGRRWRMPSVELEQWLRICLLWHDAGKLTADWQRAAHRWQEDYVRRPVHTVLARIDFEAHRNGAFPCPPHTALSARVLSRALGVLLNTHATLHLGTLAAITHHHGLARAEVVDMTPHPEGWNTLIELAALVLDERQVRRIDRVGWALTLRGQGEIPATPPTDPDAWMAYSLLSRVIRLADREVSLEEMLM